MIDGDPVFDIPDLRDETGREAWGEKVRSEQEVNAPRTYYPPGSVESHARLVAASIGFTPINEFIKPQEERERKKQKEAEAPRGPVPAREFHPDTLSVFAGVRRSSVGSLARALIFLDQPHVRADLYPNEFLHAQTNLGLVDLGDKPDPFLERALRIKRYVVSRGWVIK